MWYAARCDSATSGASRAVRACPKIAVAESFAAGASASAVPNLMVYSITMFAPVSMTASLPLPYEAASCGATRGSHAAVPFPPPNDPNRPPSEPNTTILPLPVSATIILSDGPASMPAGDARPADAPTAVPRDRSALNTTVRLLPVSATSTRPAPSTATPAGASSAPPGAERSEPASV